MMKKEYRIWNKTTVTAAALMLSASMTACSTPAAQSASADTGDGEEPEKKEAPAPEIKAEEGMAGKVEEKEETVYVNAAADGSVEKVTVSEWLKNTRGSAVLEDTSSLENIYNVKGDEEFSRSGDGRLLWAAGGRDIYYQGESSEELPVSMKLTYYLDGKEISPDELAGKSGHVKIRIDYTNNTLTDTADGGKTCTPFMMATGMILPSETFHNVKLTNGKLINDGQQNMVLGIAFPGLADSLELKDTQLADTAGIPDYVELEADAEDFSLAMTATVATTGTLSEFGLDEVDSLDDLKDSLNRLSDASAQLVDGTSELSDGAGELQEGIRQFLDGVSSAAEGSGELRDGIHTLNDKKGELLDGVNALVDGMRTLESGAGELKSGIEEYTDGVDTLAGGAGSLDDGAGKLSEGAGSLAAGADALTKGIADAKNGSDQLAAGFLSDPATGKPGASDAAQQVALGARKVSEGLNTLPGKITEMLSKQGLEVQQNKEMLLQAAGFSSVEELDQAIASTQGELENDMKKLAQSGSGIQAAMEVQESELTEREKILTEKEEELAEKEKELTEREQALEEEKAGNGQDTGEAQQENGQSGENASDGNGSHSDEADQEHAEEGGENSHAGEDAGGSQEENGDQAGDKGQSEDGGQTGDKEQTENEAPSNGSQSGTADGGQGHTDTEGGSGQSHTDTNEDGGQSHNEADNEDANADTQAALESTAAENTENTADSAPSGLNGPGAESGGRSLESCSIEKGAESRGVIQAAMVRLSAHQSLYQAPADWSVICLAEDGAEDDGKAFAPAAGELAQLVQKIAGEQEALSKMMLARTQIAGLEGASQTLEKVAGAMQQEAAAGEIRVLLEGASQVADGAEALSGGIQALQGGASQLQAGLSQMNDKSGDLINGSRELAQGASDLKAGTAQLREGVDRLKENSGKLRDGAASLAGGSSELTLGGQTLSDGAGQLSDGIGELADGADTLQDGMNELNDAGGDLQNGTNTLKDGTDTLRDGMKEFDQDGIQELSGAGDELQDVMDQLKTLVDADKSYQSYGGCLDGTKSSVKFVIETKGISAGEED